MRTEPHRMDNLTIPSYHRTSRRPGAGLSRPWVLPCVSRNLRIISCQAQEVSAASESTTANGARRQCKTRAGIGTPVSASALWALGTKLVPGLMCSTKNDAPDPRAFLRVARHVRRRGRCHDLPAPYALQTHVVPSSSVYGMCVCVCDHLRTHPAHAHDHTHTTMVHAHDVAAAGIPSILPLTHTRARARTHTHERTARFSIVVQAVESHMGPPRAPTSCIYRIALRTAAARPGSRRLPFSISSTSPAFSVLPTCASISKSRRITSPSKVLSTCKEVIRVTDKEYERGWTQVVRAGACGRVQAFECPWVAQKVEPLRAANELALVQLQSCMRAGRSNQLLHWFFPVDKDVDRRDAGIFGEDDAEANTPLLLNGRVAHGRGGLVGKRQPTAAPCSCCCPRLA